MTGKSGTSVEIVFDLGVRKGGRTLRKDVFLPSKHLLSAFFFNTPL